MNQYPDPDHPDQSPAPWVNPATTLDVPVGNALPPLQSAWIPVLQPLSTPVDTHQNPDGAPGRSMLADGMHFVGHAVLRGPCSIAGLVEGNVMQAQHCEVSVVVTETGRVKGDITAHKISVMGQTDGILDAGQGEVSLHDTARVQGIVRYGRLQVNGADLNATLERAAPSQAAR